MGLWGYNFSGGNEKPDLEMAEIHLCNGTIIQVKYNGDDEDNIIYHWRDDEEFTAFEIVEYPTEKQFFFPASSISYIIWGPIK